MFLRTWMIIWKEFIQIFRDFRTLAVVIILPFLMLLLYGYAINLDVKHLKLAVFDQNKSQDSRDLVGYFTHSEYFDLVYNLNSYREIGEILDREIARVILVVPPKFDEHIAAGHPAQVQIILDGSDSTTASTATGYANSIMQEYSADVTLQAVRRAGLIVEENFLPLEAKFRYWYNPELRSTNFLVPGLIATILMMLSALLTSMTVVRERERGTIESLVVSPVRSGELMIGKLVPYVVISFFDVILVIAAGRLIFNVPLQGSPILLLVASAIFLSAALGIGLLISVVSDNQQTAMVVAMMTTLLPSVLLSGFIFPISSMPAVIRWLTNVIPARHFIVILRGIFLKGNSVAELWSASLILLVFGLLLLGASSMRFHKKV